MKIRKVTVKTIYSIAITFKDFFEIFVSASKDSTRLSTEFSNWNLTDTSIGNILAAWKQLCHPFFDKQASDLKYIVRCLKYDGIINYGYYDKDSEEYLLTVFKYGDNVNIK